MMEQKRHPKQHRGAEAKPPSQDAQLSCECAQKAHPRAGLSRRELEGKSKRRKKEGVEAFSRGEVIKCPPRE